MRMNYVILALVTISALVGLFVSRDPERSAALSQMYRDAAFSDDAKQAVLILLALAIGGFVTYMTISRR
jgi:hypothetical protein